MGGFCFASVNGRRFASIDDLHRLLRKGVPAEIEFVRLPETQLELKLVNAETLQVRSQCRRRRVEHLVGCLRGVVEVVPAFAA